VLAIVMASTAAVLRSSTWRVLRWTANVYVEVFRGTSLLVQLFWFFFVLPLPPFNLELTPFTVAIVGLGLHYGAYGSEILRGALRSVPGGQYEAALALNMPASTRMRRIVLPQAMINALPPATNLMIELLKGTSLVSLITLSDLTFRARQLDEATFKTAEIFALTLVIYFVMAQIVVAIMRHFERRVSHGISVKSMQRMAK
jgi:polar amino acid transport system permease protein